MPSNLEILGHQTPTWQAGAIALAATAAALLAIRLSRRIHRWDATPGVKAAAVVALMATGVSMDTNWLFWGTHLHVTNTLLRAMLFADLEEALLVFAVQARENKLNPNGDGKQGIQGALVWVMSGIAMIPAWIEAGVLDGTVRAIAGPLLAATLWHFALGLEFKIERPKLANPGSIGKVLRNLRERLLARIGVTAPDQSALEIRQDRALRDAVQLADRLAELDTWFLAKIRRRRLKRRLRNAVRLSGAAGNAQRRSALLAELRAVRHATELATLVFQTPWNPQADPEPGTREPPFPSSTRDLREFQPGTDGTGNARNHNMETTARNPEPQELEQQPGTTDAGNGNVAPQAPAAHVGNGVAGTPEPVPTQEPGTVPGTGNSRNPGTRSGSSSQVPAGTGTVRNRPLGTVTTLVPKDEQLRIVRELGATVPLADIRERLGCSKAQASRLRSQIAAETKAATEAERDEEPEREVVA